MVPVLLNGTPTPVVPVPADFCNVPALLIAGVPPFGKMLWSFWTSKVVPAAMFSAPVSMDMLPLPVHVADALLLSMRAKNLVLVPLIDRGPLAFVVPPPTIPPPVQLVVPATLSVPFPVSWPLPPDSVRLDAVDAVLVLTF